MDEAKQEKLNRVDGPRIAAVREREIPSVGILRVGVHYVVHAGCKTAVFHFPSEVGLFLEGLLRDWINENLDSDTMVTKIEQGPAEPRVALYREKI